jgi:hypothetical protein
VRQQGFCSPGCYCQHRSVAQHRLSMWSRPVDLPSSQQARTHASTPMARNPHAARSAAGKRSSGVGCFAVRRRSTTFGIEALPFISGTEVQQPIYIYDGTGICCHKTRIGHDLALTEQHIASLPDGANWGPNRMMLDRIRDVQRTGRPLTTGERNFLLHKSTEARAVASGLSQDAAYAAASKTRCRLRSRVIGRSLSGLASGCPARSSGRTRWLPCGATRS